MMTKIKSKFALVAEEHNWTGADPLALASLVSKVCPLFSFNINLSKKIWLHSINVLCLRF